MKNDKLKMWSPSPGKRQLTKKIGWTFLFAFFFACMQINAQTLQQPTNYVSPAQAIQLLDQEIDSMNDDLSQLTFDTPEYQDLQLHIWFYTGVKRQLDNNATVANAITTNYSNLRKVTEIQDKSKTWSQEVITLLSN